MNKKFGREYASRYRHHFKLRSKIREHNQNKAKNILKYSVISVILIAVIIFAGQKTYQFAFRSDVFKLKEIRIEGLKTIHEDEFRSVLGVKCGDNLIATYFGKLDKNIKSKFLQIKSVKIQRSLPGRITFKVFEREPIVWTKAGGKIYFVDDENISFNVRRSTSDLPQIETDCSKSCEEGICLLKNIKNKKLELYSRILKLYNIKDRFIFLLKDNIEVLWGEYNDESFKLKYNYLINTLEYALKKYKPVGHVNLELCNEGRIIVKPQVIKENKKVKVKRGKS